MEPFITTQVVFQSLRDSQISYGDYRGQSSYQTLQSYWYGFSSCGGHSKLGGATPQCNPIACYSCRKNGYFFREFPRHEVVVHTELVCIPCKPRVLGVGYSYGKDYYGSRECSHYQSAYHLMFSLCFLLGYGFRSF